LYTVQFWVLGCLTNVALFAFALGKKETEICVAAGMWGRGTPNMVALGYLAGQDWTAVKAGPEGLFNSLCLVLPYFPDRRWQRCA
jgi:hypothetical protein